MKAFSMFKSLTVAFCLVELLLVGCSKQITQSREANTSNASESNAVQSEDNHDLNNYAREEYEISLFLDSPVSSAEPLGIEEGHPVSSADPVAVQPAVVPQSEIAVNDGASRKENKPVVPQADVPQSEVKKHLCAEIRSENLALRLSRILARLDSDKSGDLSAEEFSETYAKSDLPAGVLEKIKVFRKALFTKFAGDDKRLSAEEISLLIKDRYIKHCKMMLAQNNGVEGEKFKSFYEDLSKKLDANGDGKISMEEFLAFKKKMDDFGKSLPVDKRPAVGPQPSGSIAPKQ